RSNFINAIGALAVFMLIYAMIGHGVFNRYYTGIIQLACIYSIAAVSLNLVVGLLGQLALGHAGFMSVGAYTCALFCIGVELPHGLTFPVALLLGGLMAALFG